MVTISGALWEYATSSPKMLMLPLQLGHVLCFICCVFFFHILCFKDRSRGSAGPGGRTDCISYATADQGCDTRKGDRCHAGAFRSTHLPSHDPSWRQGAGLPPAAVPDPDGRALPRRVGAVFEACGNCGGPAGCHTGNSSAARTDGSRSQGIVDKQRFGFSDPCPALS